MARLTRTLAASAVAAVTLGTTGAVLAPADASPAGHHHGQQGQHHANAELSLTRSAAATLDRYNVDIKVAKNNRTTHHAFLRGAVVFDGDATTTWSKIRVNERTNRISAVVNGDRVAVLRFRGSCSAADSNRSGHHGGSGTVLRLTKAGASSIDHAAGADAFDAGDAFATAGHR